MVHSPISWAVSRKVKHHLSYDTAILLEKKINAYVHEKGCTEILIAA
jgi:ribosomal protein L31E